MDKEGSGHRPFRAGGQNKLRTCDDNILISTAQLSTEKLMNILYIAIWSYIKATQLKCLPVSFSYTPSVIASY